MTSSRSWSVPLIFVYLFSTLLIAGCGKPTLDTIKVEPAASTLTVEREKAAKIVAAVEPPEVTTGQQVQLTVTVQNAEGRGIATVPVQAQPTSQDTAIDPPNATTDANGQATFTITVARQAMVN